MSDVVIRAENLSKYYNLGVINNGTLFRDIQTWWALKRGKEDPHSQIGSHKYDTTKDGFWALKDLNFEIKQGDRVGIIGKNGAGKSTLLKVLSRITAPTEGQVKIKGRVASLLEVGTGFHAELTGRENIYLNGAILGMKRKEVDRKIDEIIAFSEIENHIDTPVKRYSSGMYVRLAFAVAAHLDSEILIADEVLAVGDAAFQKKALGKMNDLSTGQGRTVLFVSHNMGQVKFLCQKGLILDHGSLTRQDNNIQDSIRWYLGLEEELHGSASLLTPDYINDIISITDIKINGKNTNSIEINEEHSSIGIFIRGNLKKAILMNIELFFTDSNGNRFAYYSPSHFNEENFKKQGEFTIEESINLKGLSKGRFFVEFNISEPRGQLLYRSKNPLIINSEGCKTLFNEYHPYEQIGYFVLNKRG